MTEQLQAEMTNQTLLVQKDALYSAGAPARQELSNRLTAAAFDFDLNELNEFTTGPSFLQDELLVEPALLVVPLGHDKQICLSR